MKIRTGHVSNSSSSSFCIPVSLLTDEQKELLLSLDSEKESKARLKKQLGTFSDFDPKDSKNDYPVNEEYHRIYEDMVKAGEWDDSPWDIGESKKTKCISGSSWMWNGSIEKLCKRIGIDPGAIEIINHGHLMVHMATHPEAVKYHLWRHGEWVKQFNSFPDDLKEMEIEFGHRPYSRCPYAVPDEEFEEFGSDSLEYEPEPEDDYQEIYSFIKDKNNES